MDESRSAVNPDVGATEFSDINAADDQMEPLRFEEEKSHAVQAPSESEGEQSNGSTPIVESQPLLETKRVRKKVQRLSETLSKAHEEKAEQKAQAAKEISASLQAGKGTELGAIPLIEDSFRKTKPVNLKPLHLIVYGRLGAVNEVRSNLRKFRGFGFGPGSPEYTKKVSSIQQRPTNEIREVLRLLHLEVSGTREVMATRLMDFLLRPSASLVKYKGKIVKKSGKGKTSGGKKRSSKKSASKSASTEASSENASHPDEDSMESDVSSSESEEPVAPKPPKKRTNPQKKENGVKPPAKKRAVLDDSVSDISDDEPKSSKVPQTLTQSGADSDSDVPLSNLTSKKKAAYPSDQELKSSIIDLLKTVDLEQTSLKVVREQLFSRYPGLDLSDKKEFINTTVKETERSMEVTSRKPLLEKHDNLEIRKKPPRQLATKRKCGRKAIACIGSVLLAVFIQLIVYALLGQYVFMKTPIDVDLTEAEKCPACTGQSSCPVFFRGEVFVPAFQYTKLKQGHPTPAGVEATIGLYEASKRLNLRRMGSPATADTVDNAVCRRGLPHGYAEASDDARSKIRCIPHLSIWRWRPTNSPEMSGSSESVETPLHRGLVAAPSYLSQDNASTEVASDQTMLTAFSPAVRCASDRLFSHLLSSFRERTSVGAETRWLRFDELMFLFNLAVDPQPLLWQAFPRSKHWPLPAYTGACGRWTLQDYHGVPLERFCGAPLWLRLRILSSILKIPELLQHVSSSATSSQSDGYAIYLGNFHLGSLFTVDPITYNVTVANLRHSIVVDVDTAIKYNQESDFTIPLEATDYVISHFPSHQCDGNLSSTGDSGGSTPPCLSTEHADNLCTHSSSDHNYWAICTALLHGWSPSDTCSRFLDDMPAELMDALRRCVADTRPRSRRVDVREAQRIVDHLIEEHVEPFAWWPM